MAVARTPLAAGVLAFFDGKGGDAARDWLEETLGNLSESVPTEGSAGERQLRILFARARRKTGRNELPLDAGSCAKHGLPAAMAVPNWRAFDLARLAMLSVQLEALPAAEHVGLVTRLFRSGELGEQESILRCLAFLPGPERFVELAVDACRTNAVSVFSALAARNPYPAEHFAEANFNQMILKALFIGAPVREVVRLSERNGAELGRMVRGYASEREAAGRALSDDHQFVLQLTAANA